ncbi:AAA family ATPase [Micromonospora sp. NPDC049101]|uniref:helix-turn-helix transcriptional regulator n=1 Tax=Micromonospora sp. NPDC049101 TaxID=3155032 RepID=UPI0033C846AA
MERQHQLRVVDDAFQACHRNAGALVLVEGYFGTGKTALLKAVKDRGGVEGFAILQARGSEFETGFPYGVVRQLLEYHLSSMTEEERAAVFTGAAALAAPLFHHQTTPGPHSGEPHSDDPAREQSVLRGLYRMLVNLADRQPLLLLLDDIHWADGPSLRFLHYIEGRLEQQSILCVATTASVDRGYNVDVTHAFVTSPAVHLLPVGVLSEEGVREVLASALGFLPDDALVRVCHQATGGNPFFLHELISEIRAESGAERPLSPALVARAGPRNVARVVHRWVQRASQEHVDNATTLARGLAVLGNSGDFDQLAGVTGLSRHEVAEAASVLIDIGVVESDTHLRYVHPIVRNAVYEHMPRTTRYRAHTSAARTLASSGAPPEQVAEHLLHAPPSNDSRVAEVLIAAGQRALRLGDFTLAVALFRRAEQEAVSAEMLPRLLAHLGEAEHRARDAGAVEHLTQALDLTVETAARASIALNLSGALTAAVRYKEALDVLQGVRLEAQDQHPELANRLHAEIIKIAQLTSATRPVAESALAEFGDAGPDAAVGALALLRAQQAFEALFNGEPATNVIPLCEDALLQGPLVREPDGGAQAAWLIALCLYCCGRLSEAGAVLDDAIQRAEGLRLGLASDDLRSLRAYVHLNRGMLAEADGDATGVLAGATPDDLPALGRPFAVLALTELLLLRNQTSGAVDAFKRYGMSAEIPHQVLFLPLMLARGRFHIAQNLAEAGALDLLRTHELLEDWGARCPAFSPSVPAVEALADLGRRDEARRLAHRHLTAARAFGEDRVIGAALGAYARTVTDGRQLDLLEEAATLLEGTGALIDECTVLIQLGIALRGAGESQRARVRLRTANDIAEATGARVLAKKARQQLATMGVRVRESARTGLAGLSPREHRVALLAAEGKRNREIARILFVTVKTVEWHLSQAYRKLGITSREELRDALART